MKDKLLNFLIVLFSLIIVVSLIVIFIFYNPSVVTEHFKEKPKRESGTEVSLQTSQEIPSPTVEPEAQLGEVPQEVEERVKELGEALTNYLVYLKGGIGSKPALVFKVKPQDRGVNLYLLTYYPMEWPFVRADLGGYGAFPLEKVYLCRGGLLVLQLRVRGLFPPEVSRGKVDGYGALLTFSGGKPQTLPFEEGKCIKNGFVFDLAGEFAGVCFGGEFIGADQLYEEIPQACKIIYSKGGK